MLLRTFTRAGLLLAAALVLLVTIRTPFNFYDEGFAVFNAVRVMNGETPYRDFWTIYSPGQSYALAAVFRLFDVTALPARLYDTALRLLIVAACYLLAGKITTPRAALAATAGVTVLLAAATFHTYALFPALACALWAAVFLLEFVERNDRCWLWLGGAWIGLAAFFRWDVGLYAALGLGGALLLFVWLRSMQQRRDWRLALGAISRAAAPFVGGIGIVALSLYGYVIWRSGVTALWAQMIVFPTTHMRLVRWLPYPTLVPEFSGLLAGDMTMMRAWQSFFAWLQFYLPLTIYGCVILYFADLLLRRRSTVTSHLFGGLALSAFGLLLFAQALSRYDFIHVVPSTIPATLLFAVLSAKAAGQRQRLTALVVPPLLVGLVTLYMAWPLATLARHLYQFAPWQCHSQLVRASCAPLMPDQQQAVQYLQAQIPPDMPIFVGNQRHDRIFVNDVGFYFLSGHPSATRYSELHPGVTTTRPVQQEIIAELTQKQTQWLVLVNIWDSGEPNASAQSSGVYDLDEFIHAHYQVATEFGMYQLWKRDD